jgi:hypothetical protein
LRPPVTGDLLDRERAGGRQRVGGAALAMDVQHGRGVVADLGMERGKLGAAGLQRPHQR